MRLSKIQAANLEPDRIPKEPLVTLLPVQNRRSNPNKQLCHLLQHTHTAQDAQLSLQLLECVFLPAVAHPQDVMQCGDNPM